MSVVIPMYNASKTIARALDSILGQTASPVEVIVVDDRSTDDCMKLVVNQYAPLFGDALVLASHLRNSGPGSARNLGIDIAKSDLVAFLDSDDTWLPEKIEIQYSIMTAHSDVMLSAHAIAEVTETPRKRASNELFRDVSFQSLLRSNRFSTPAVMIRKLPGLRFSEKSRFSEDYLMWLRYASQSRVIMIPEILGHIHKPRFGHSGLSASLFKMAFFELANYRVLSKEGRINGVQMLLFSTYSAAKSVRRILGQAILKIRLSVRRYAGATRQS